MPAGIEDIVPAVEAMFGRGVEAFDRGEIIELRHAAAGRSQPATGRASLLVEGIAIEGVAKDDPPLLPFAGVQPRANPRKAGWIIDFVAVDAKDPRIGIRERNEHLVGFARIAD